MTPDATIVTRPALRVVRKGSEGRNLSTQTAYEAQSITLATHDGRWVLAFLCSGGLVTIPTGEVERIEMDADGCTFCVSCDERLTAYPANEPERLKLIRKAD